MIKKTNDLTFSERLSAPKPPFFATLQKWAIALAALATIILGSINLLPQDNAVTEWIEIICRYVIFGNAILAGFSQLPVDEDKYQQQQIAKLGDHSNRNWAGSNGHGHSAY